jgi:hypothetical protein
MAKQKSGNDIEFVDELPPVSRGQTGRWIDILLPLLKHKGRYARVQTCDNPQQAQDIAGNLRKGRVLIPEPTHDWSFAARGCEVYAIYRGPKNQARRRRN